MLIWKIFNWIWKASSLVKGDQFHSKKCPTWRENGIDGMEGPGSTSGPLDLELDDPRCSLPAPPREAPASHSTPRTHRYELTRWPSTAACSQQPRWTDDTSRSPHWTTTSPSWTRWRSTIHSTLPVMAEDQTRRTSLSQATTHFDLVNVIGLFYAPCPYFLQHQRRNLTGWSFENRLFSISTALSLPSSSS